MKLFTTDKTKDESLVVRDSVFHLALADFIESSVKRNTNDQLSAYYDTFFNFTIQQRKRDRDFWKSVGSSQNACIIPEITYEYYVDGQPVNTPEPKSFIDELGDYIFKNETERSHLAEPVLDKDRPAT
jgi:hypothetical protein